jgi:hypothetical protein
MRGRVDIQGSRDVMQGSVIAALDVVEDLVNDSV